MKSGQKLVTVKGKQIPGWPLTTVRITQPYGDNYSHAGSLLLDVTGGKAYAPVDVKCVYVDKSSAGIHQAWFETVNPVPWADGKTEDYFCFNMGHCVDVSHLENGKVFLQGQHIYSSGGFGPKGPTQYPAHIHFGVARGKIKLNSGGTPVMIRSTVKSEIGIYISHLPDEVYHYDVFFINDTTLDATKTVPLKYPWRTFDFNLDKQQYEAELAKIEEEKKAAEEAAKLQAELEALNKKNYYTVKPGDTLTKIAIQNNISMTELYQVNKKVIGPNPNVLRVGIVLLIPRGGIGQAITNIKVGDSVIWWGNIYRDSFGGGKSTKVFDETQGIVDIFNKNTYPVHIKGKGWVSIKQVKKV